ncbi:MAG: SMC-Scp complex subunit ScpB [Lachnospiraceae bacterium]|nr:SMC-Scp complex subunit ScpB [Lachnospiraceae bacterium]
MNPKEIEAQIEAILFTMGEAVESDRLAAALGHDVDTIRRIARNMADRYDSEDRGIQMIEINDSFQLCTKASMYEAIIKIAHVPKKHVLSDSVLETLSIVAYKQPVTRSEIEAIRGVSCEHAVNKLLEYKLITELGRLNAPGKPILFGTTEEFLRSFGLVSLEDLPVVKPEKIEDFKIEVEDELQLKLDI